MSDELVKRWIWNRVYDHKDLNPHFKGCQEVEIKFDLYDDQYGCDTGCEYVRLEATIECEACEIKQTVEYGEFGEMGSLIRSLEEFEKTGTNKWGYGEGSIYIYDA